MQRTVMHRSVATELSNQVEGLLQQVEELKKVVKEKDSELVEAHQASLQNEQELMESYDSFHLEGYRKGKKGRKSFKNIIESEMAAIIAEVVRLTFRECKFQLKKVLLKYSEEDNGSLCARVRVAMKKSKLPFGQRLWMKAGTTIVVHEMVAVRAKYVGCVRRAYYSKCVCCFAVLVNQL